MTYNSARIAASVASLVLVGLALAGCAAATEAEAEAAPSATNASKPQSDDTPATKASPYVTPTFAPTPTPTVTPNQSPRREEYAAEIASWPEPLPPGYSWPAWADLPHFDLYGLGQLGQADNASGVYRCILIDAAWHAYFEANDPVASKDYATRADKYAIPDNPATPPVTQDGVIVDSELARASGICLGIAGELSH